MRPIGTVMIVLLLATALAVPALGGDEKSEVWLFEKGPVKRELDVTHMPEELRQALLSQLEASGWKRVVDLGLPEGEGEDEAEEEEADEPKPPSQGETPVPSIRRDLEDLVKLGGRLPEDFLPHGMPPAGSGPVRGAVTAGLGRAAGKLILRYLEVKDDPAKGPIYAGILRELATALTQEPDEQGATAHAIGMGLLRNAMLGLRSYVDHPAGGEAGAYREIVELLREAMDEAMRGLRMPGPPALPGPRVRGAPIDMPRELGGATLGIHHVDAGRVELRVASVPAGSLAQEMGLGEGDAIVAVDGRPADLAGLRRAREIIRRAGQLSLRVKRRDGRIEQLDIEFEVEDRPEDGDAR